MYTFERSTAVVDKEYGYFHFAFDLNLKYEISEGLTYTKADTHKESEDIIKVSFKKEVQNLVFELEAQFKVFNFKTLEEAIKHRKKGGFKAAFKALQGTCRGSLGVVDIAGGLEISRDPIVIKVIRDISSNVGKATIEGELHLGLSKNGWFQIAMKVSRSTLVTALQEEGFTGALNYVVSLGILEIAGALVGTAALAALAVAVTDNQRRLGGLRGLESAYYGAYLKTIFADSGVSLEGWAPPALLNAEDRKIWEVLDRAGRSDAHRHACITLSRLKEPYDPSDPDDAPIRLQRLLIVRFRTAQEAYEHVKDELHRSAGPLLGQ